MAGTNGNGNGNGAPKVGTDTVKQGLAQMLKGGVIVSWPTSDGFSLAGSRGTSWSCQRYAEKKVVV